MPNALPSLGSRPAFKCLGILAEPGWFHDRREKLLQLPMPKDNARWQTMPSEIFTDGSTLENQMPDATFAGSGYCACFVEHRQRLFSCWVPGLQQTSDRAEVFAVKMVLAKVVETSSRLQSAGCDVVLTCDCEWVVKRLQKLVGEPKRVNSHESHQDLWMEIGTFLHDLVQRNVVIVPRRVPSHITRHQAQERQMSELTRKGNDAADAAAKAGVRKAVSKCAVAGDPAQLRSDIDACNARLLHNMQIVNNRWVALKHVLPPEAEDADDSIFNDAQDDTVPGHVEDLSQPSSSSARPAVASNDSQRLYVISAHSLIC